MDELCHYGIKGQKWGVRRFQNEDGSLTKAGKKDIITVSSKQCNERDKTGFFCAQRAAGCCEAVRVNHRLSPVGSVAEKGSD